MKVADLDGALLDYWVARACGLTVLGNGIYGGYVCIEVIDDEERQIGHGEKFRPSADWSQGGPLIEEHEIAINYGFAGHEGIQATMATEAGYLQVDGPTVLIAAMRTLVASEYGETVPGE